jgi:hypothetical protein
MAEGIRYIVEPCGHEEGWSLLRCNRVGSMREITTYRDKQVAEAAKNTLNEFAAYER